MTLSVTALANKLDVQIMEEDGGGQLATCASSTVAGLSVDGDGFLAVRSGPGSQYRKLAEFHNGDVVCGDPKSDECASTNTRPVTNSKKGWVHTKWLKDLAG